jgi:hypothetical protein
LCNSPAPAVQKGIVEIPIDPKTLGGTYAKVGSEINLYPDGTYTAIWRGCFPPPDEAAGTWRLEGNVIAFTMTNHRGWVPEWKEAKVLRYDGRWILLPITPFYDRMYLAYGIDICYEQIYKKW